jgi:glutaminase
LTLMLSCGMYDYSGSWMLYVGLPAKSGVAGLVYVVIPHVMGIAIWSPPLDSHGNSHKAVEFYKRLLSKYKFGIFDRFVQQSRYALADEEAAADSGAGMAPLQKRFAGSSAEAVTARLEAHEVGTAASRRHIVTQLGAVRRDKLRKAAMRLRTILSGFRRLWRRGQEIDGSVLVFNLAKALVPVATVVTALQEEGIDVASHKLAGRQLKEMEAATVADNGEAGRGQVSFPSLFLPDADHANVILRALEGSLVVKSFSKFTADISMIYTVVKSISSADAEKASVLTTAARDRGPTAEAEAVGKAALRRAVSTAEAEEVAPPGPGMPLRTGRGSVHGRGSVFGRGSTVGTARPGGGLGRGGDSSSLTSFEDGEEVVRYPYGVAVCTVDGQQFTSGDTDWSVPLMSVVKPLLYAMALEDIGEDVVSQWVATEPTQVDPAGFDLLKPGSSHGGGGDESHSEVPMAAKETEAEEKEGEEEEEGKAGASARRGSSASAAARVPARPHDSLRAYNPFMDSGSLAVCSLLGCGKAHKVPATFRGTSEKFSFVTSRLSKWSGNNKVQFSNPNFLALKQRALKPKAVSHYMKGMDCMLPESDPTDTAYLMYQSYSIQTSLPQLATIAATIAAIGRCPTTGERCMSGDVVKRLLSTMYSAGLNRYSGRWNFTVGIPAVYSSASGLLMLVIPNVAGMVIWAPSAISYAAGFAQPSIPPHPRSHEAATFGLLQELARILLDGRALLTDDVVEHRARRFCELLTEKFHVNVFDQLVHGDDQVEAHDEDEDDLVAKEETPRTKLGRAATAALLFFELCTAAGNGDLMAVRKLIDDGVDVARADYDKRTALHIACSDGHLAVATLLVDTGAPVLAKDRWGQTPLDDARKSGNPSLVMVLEAALRRQGRSVPAARA